MPKRSSLQLVSLNANQQTLFGAGTYSQPLDAKNGARALAEAAPPKLRIEYAQAFCTTAITRYWERLHSSRGRALRSPPVTGHVSAEAQAIAKALGDAAANMSVEDAGYFVGSTYAAMLPTDFRASRGVYYTPPVVVRRLLDSAEASGVDWTQCHVLDPACGGGAFLGPIARRIIDALKGCERRVVARNISARLRGYEIDPFAAWLASVFLDATVYSNLGGLTGCQDVVEVCDSLERDTEGRFDLVIGNPPYGRISLSTEQRARFQRSLYGHANLYGVFLDLAIRQTRPNGIIAFVTPTSFLSGEYFKKLRCLLAEEANPVSLDFIAEREGVFDDVLQETMLAVYARHCAARRPKIHFVKTDAAGVKVTSAGRAALSLEPEAPWILPRRASDVAFAARLRRIAFRLDSWGYRVSTGPLVWNRYKAQLRQRASADTVPVIWAEAVSADGKFAFRAARRNHSPYIAVRSPDKWLLVDKPCVLLQRTTSKEQPRRLIAAELDATFLAAHKAVTVENHLNMLVPVSGQPEVAPSTLAAFLNSSAADRAFRCISGSVAVSASELESMPVPSPYDMVELTSLLRRKPTRDAIDRLCERLYGDE